MLIGAWRVKMIVLSTFADEADALPGLPQHIHMRPFNSADLRTLVPRAQLAEPLHCAFCPLILSTVGRGGGQQHSDQVLARVAVLGGVFMYTSSIKTMPA